MTFDYELFRNMPTRGQRQTYNQTMHSHEAFPGEATLHGLFKVLYLLAGQFPRTVVAALQQNTELL
jgi:hypothetical protein